MQRSIMITGATGNLGTAVTRYFLRKEWQVITIDKSAEAAENEGALDNYVCDLSVEKETQEVFSEIFEKHPDLDAAVFLAGGFSMGDIHETTVDDLDRMVALNFKTAYNAARPTIHHFENNRGGDIIFIGAKPVLELTGASSMVAYTLSKSMVVKLAEIINEIDTEPSLRASVIAPSVIDTPANRQAMPDADYSAWVKPEAIAGAAAFLLSGEGRNLRQTIFRMYNES